MVSSNNLDPEEATWVAYFGQSFYHQTIVPLLVLTLVLAWFARPSTSEPLPLGFRSFQIRYLAGWCLCVAADWLQGPYVYALYSAYGYSKHENARLFVAGFGSSLVFGCFVGSLADQFGRKKSALAYCLCYILSCMTKHVNIYWVLMLGRVLGGIATSLLFSCFECWMVSEHQGRYGFSGGLLGYMFGLMYQLMYVVAILSGMLAQFAADKFPLQPIHEDSATHFGGATAPFDCAIVALLIGAVHIATTWHENYGSSSSSTSTGQHSGIVGVMREAIGCVQRDRRVLLLGVVVACFEGAMFAFVFNWTPALEDKSSPPPLGLIFSTFMMACMCGASIGTISGSVLQPDSRVFLVCATGVASFFVIVFAVSKHYLRACFGAFLLFECMVGVYFPSVGVLKSEVVPEHVRSTVYNIYRVPLNGVVVCLLLTNLSMLRCYGLCASLILLALVSVAAIKKSQPLPLGIAKQSV